MKNKKQGGQGRPRRKEARLVRAELKSAALRPRNPIPAQAMGQGKSLGRASTKKSGALDPNPG